MIKRHLKSFTAAALALVLALSAVGCGKKAGKPVAKTADSSDKPAFNIDISGNKKDAAARPADSFPFFASFFFVNEYLYLLAIMELSPKWTCLPTQACQNMKVSCCHTISINPLR